MQMGVATEYFEPTLPSAVAALRSKPGAEHAAAPNGEFTEAILARLQTLEAPGSPDAPDDNEHLRKTFYSFVGQTLFGQLLQAMRKTVGRPAYFYGSRVESIFQRQLDQLLAERISDASADRLAEPMFELFSLRRS